MGPGYLFNSSKNYLEQRKLALKQEVESLGSNDLLNVSEEDFYHYLFDKYSFEAPVLRENEICVADQSEVSINDIRGLQVTIAIPFDGDGELFNYMPSNWTSVRPQGEIVGGEVHLIYERGGHNPEELKQTYIRDLAKVKQYLDWVIRDVENFNNLLKDFIRQVVAQRKEKLLNDQAMVSSLGIPIKKRSDLPQTYAVPVIRRKLKIERPKATTEPFKPEPLLALAEYEDILKIISNMALAMERSPRTFSKLTEEEIRDFFLIYLNGYYEGQATGETFNYSGKTDILVRAEGKNIFIAECKIWRGEKELLETIDQLLGYTSWRDTKTAILLFSRNKDFSNVLQKIPNAIKSHSCYKREIGVREDTIFLYTFHQPEDVNRELMLTVTAFNVPY